MKHLSAAVNTAEQVAEFLGRKTTQDAIASARAILVQLFVGRADIEWIGHITDAIHAVAPGAVVIGATSAGEIAQGRVSLDSTVISISCFHSSGLYPIIRHCPDGEEYQAGRAIAESLEEVPALKAALLLAPAIALNCARLLDGINDRLPGTAVFGGGAAATEASAQSLVFLDKQFSESGAVAVALAGNELHIESHVFLGWKALGPRMTLTDVDGFNIRSIDDKPAFEVYRKYLSIEPGDDLFLLEFPLLIERHGTMLARNPVSSDKQGCVTLVADIYSGESARLGYLDVDTVIEHMRGTLTAMESFAPEAIFLYSCICRRFSLQQDTELETFPFQGLAPVAGFFTYGEFCRISNRLQLLNSSQVVVGMREGDARPLSQLAETRALSDVDRYRVRHIRVTSRLFQFIGALTDEVEEANRALQFQAEHDPLTDALNRRALNENLVAEICRSRRFGHKLSIVMFDLDHFKRFNDEHGHAAGDHVLKSVASTIRGLMRANDALYRYGGEEFLLLLPETPLEGALVFAEKARASIESMALDYEGESLTLITASFGVACYPDHGDDGMLAIRAADAALYRAKGDGRNRVSSFTGKQSY